MSETRDYPNVRAKLTRDALSIDLIGLAETMSPEDRLEFCRAITFERRIFEGLCEAIASEHGWLYQDSLDGWSWGGETADALREKLIPLMPEAAVHLIKRAKDEAARQKRRAHNERLYASELRRYAQDIRRRLVEQVGPKNVARVPLPESPKIPADAIEQSRQRAAEARAEVEEALAE